MERDEFGHRKAQRMPTIKLREIKKNRYFFS